MTLLADDNCPGSQLVSNWEPAHSLVEDAVSGAKIASRLLALAVARLPLCLRRGEGPIHSWLALLWHSLSPLFCEWARLCFRLELYAGKFLLSLSFFPLSLAIPQFGLLSQVSSLRLSSGHSVPVPTLSMQPMPPCSAPTHCWRMLSIWATSPLGVVVRCVICVYFILFFPPGYVALWVSKTAHRPTSEMVSWCLETSPPS